MALQARRAVPGHASDLWPTLLQDFHPLRSRHACDKCRPWRLLLLVFLLLDLTLILPWIAKPPRPLTLQVLSLLPLHRLLHRACDEGRL